MHYSLVLTGTLQNETLTHLARILRHFSLKMSHTELGGEMLSTIVTPKRSVSFKRERELMSALHDIPGIQGVGFCADQHYKSATN